MMEDEVKYEGADSCPNEVINMDIYACDAKDWLFYYIMETPMDASTVWIIMYIYWQLYLSS